MKYEILKEWEEVIGELVDFKDCTLIIKYHGRSNRFLFTPNEVTYFPDLKEYIGKRIGILKTDLPNKPVILINA